MARKDSLGVRLLLYGDIFLTEGCGAPCCWLEVRPHKFIGDKPIKGHFGTKKPLNLDPYSLQQGKRSGFGGERGGVSSNEGWLPGCHASKEHGPNVFKSPVRGLGVTDASEMAPGPQWPFWGALPPDRARRRGNAGWLPSPKMDPQGFVPQGPS